MNLKKLLLSGVAVALVLSLTSCGSAEEAASAVESEAESTAESAVSETVSEDTVESNTAGDFEILEASADNTSLSSGSATVSISSKSISLSGAYVVDGIDAVITGGTYKSTASDQNVFLVINGGSLTISNAEIVKSGDAGASDSTRTSDVSDDYNFYGINSVVLCVGDGSSVNISECTISSSSSGANAVFATDEAEITASNLIITTDGNSSRGVYATYDGVINADHIEITTSGAHCAPIATDRGGGSVTVSNSTVTCSGDGSPCIYSTGDITVTNVVGTADGAQACVIEGKNTITMTDCSFSSTNANNGAMLYQSMSGDAADSDAASSVSILTMTNSSITSDSDGAMFYITNTTAEIHLNGGNTLTTASGTLVNAATGNWGSSGKNGGTLTLYSSDDLTEAITADSISSIAVILSGATLTGTTSGSVTVTNE